jgi:multiple sugar transport system permease protein
VDAAAPRRLRPPHQPTRRGWPRLVAARAVLHRRQGLLFVLPALFALAALVGYPIVDTVILSLTDDQGSFAGASNFSAVLDDPTTALAARNSLVVVVVSIFFQMLLGTIAGILLNQRFRGRAFTRTALLIPWVIPSIVAATTWAWMFHYEFGIFNAILMQLHLIAAPLGWLTDIHLVLPSVIAVSVWKIFPFVALMVLAALQAIPESLYEAARVDGASFLQQVRHIMIPQLRTVLMSVALLLLIWEMNGITIIYAMTRGGPANQSLVVPIQIYKAAFEAFQFNQAAALSLMLFAVLLVVIALRMTLLRPEEERSGA